MRLETFLKTVFIIELLIIGIFCGGPDIAFGMFLSYFVLPEL